MKKSLYLIKKIIRKLYHLIWFLSVFFIVSLPVNAAVNVTPPMDRYATIFLDGSIKYFNNSSWVNDNAFWSPGYVPQIATPSTPSEPSSYAWLASGTSYCGTNGGNITGFMGSANGSFFTYLQKIEFHSDGGNSLCSFTNANNEGTLVQFSCVSSNLANFSIHYKYKNAPGVMVGQYPILGRSMSVTCNSSDSSAAINNQTQQIIQNDNSNTQQIIENNNSNSQQIIENNNSNTDKIDGTLKDDTAPSVDLSDIETSDTPISDLVTLPLTLLNSIYNGISGSCSNWTLQLPFNHSVLLECFTISDYVGSSVALIIDTAICLFMAYRIVLLFIAVFDDITTLSDTYTNYVKRGRY